MDTQNYSSSKQNWQSRPIFWAKDKCAWLSPLLRIYKSTSKKMQFLGDRPVTVLYTDVGIRMQEENPHVRHWNNSKEMSRLQ